MKATQMRPSWVCLLRAFYSMRVSQPLLDIGKHSKADRGVRKLYSGKWVDFKCALIGSSCHGEERRMLRISGHPMWLVSKHIWISLVGPELETWAKYDGSWQSLTGPEHSGSIACTGCSSSASWTSSVKVMGQDSFVIWVYGLAVIDLCI